MDCKHCAENLTAYLDGELDRAEAARVRDHAEACPACALELRGLQASAALIAGHARELELSPASWNAVYDRISHAEPKSLFRPWALGRWSRAFAVLAVAAACALGYLWYQQGQRQTLNAYINQYIQAREARRPLHAMNGGGALPFGAGNPFAENPYGKNSPESDVNPFRLEDR